LLQQEAAQHLPQDGTQAARGCVVAKGARAFMGFKRDLDKGKYLREHERRRASLKHTEDDQQYSIGSYSTQR